MLLVSIGRFMEYSSTAPSMGGHGIIQRYRDFLPVSEDTCSISLNKMTSLCVVTLAADYPPMEPFKRITKICARWPQAQSQQEAPTEG